MKIQLASDLHLDLLAKDHPDERIIAPVPGADVLVLAGDISDGAQVFRQFSYWPSVPVRVPIIVVAGNHEFYHHTIEPTREKMKEGAALNNIHFLENESVEIDGVRFLGTTLWTDYKIDKTWSQRGQMSYVEKRLNDHRLIRTGRHTFKTQDALDCHERAKSWLINEMAKPWAGKTVVVTHHGPHPLSVHPRFKDNEMNAAFVSDLSDLLPGADLWLHGHVHDSFDYQVGRCRVVANPAGYVLNRGYAARDEFEFENRLFDRNLLVEI